VISHLNYKTHQNELGMRRTNTGALLKDFDRSPEKEIFHAFQTIITTVVSEDPRFAEKRAPSLKEEFPVGSKVFFLGEHGYGVAAQVTEVGKASLTIMLAV
jgi:5'-3' exoribonuclease 1